MTLKKESLLYDISNLAYVIADCEESGHHRLHQVFDITEEGNVDRVARVMWLAFAKVQEVFSSSLVSVSPGPGRDFAAKVQDYSLVFSESIAVSQARLMKIKELLREYLVCTALADWLGITLAEVSSIWLRRAEAAFGELSLMASEISAGGELRRRLSPF